MMSMSREKTLKVVSILVAAMAAAATLVLVLHHLAGMELPGCGPTSACAELASSPWGNVVGWPVSLLGLAYFLGVTVAYTVTLRRGIPLLAQLVLFAGGIVSLAFLGIMAFEGKWCVYCLVIHACNLSLVGLTLAQRSSTSTLVWTSSFGSTFLVVSAILAIVLFRHADRITQRQRDQTEQSISAILDQTQNDSDAVPPTDGGFAGRYRQGPEEAAVRLVVFHDYQCKECLELDTELALMLKQYPTVSVTVLHYPLCSQCNDTVTLEFLHKQACDAAYLAEAAGQLAGGEVFWKVHRWLIEHKAKIDDPDLDRLCRECGLTLEELTAAGSDERVRKVVLSDIALANSLGATGTPFVFLNGVEVRGAAGNPGNVRLAVESVLASAPPPHTSAWDRRPPVAAERLITEWLAAEPVTLPERESARLVFGDVSAESRVLLFLEPSARDALQLWNLAKRLPALHSDVRVEVYLFPISRELNPRFAKLKTDIFPRSTDLTRLVVALSASDTVDSTAALDWCLATDKTAVGEALFHAGADHFQVSREDLTTTLTNAGITEQIASDLAAAEVAHITWAPELIVNKRRTPTTMVTAEVIDAVLRSTRE
ncbi:MAG: DsbA family protein [Planctomycetales bacterium]|nr:DsbA family protein [Planctomycetales bacterium]